MEQIFKGVLQVPDGGTEPPRPAAATCTQPPTPTPAPPPTSGMFFLPGNFHDIHYVIFNC